MRKAIIPPLAAFLAIMLLAGCRGNVSERSDGMVTEPGTMPSTSATMPGTDTAPIDTLPPAATQQTTAPTGETEQEDRASGAAGVRGSRGATKRTNPGAPAHRS